MTDQGLDQNDNVEERSLYGGRWIACIGDRIVGQGGTPQQALNAAKASRFKETPEISYVPMAQPIIIHPILEKIAPLIPQDLPVYIVGGAIRDALLGVPVHDLDFALPERTTEIARKIADKFDGSLFTLDKERDYRRVILTQSDSTRLVMDFTPLQGKDIEGDLHDRDFTVNAMAIELHNPQELLDPTGGKVDLYQKRLRTCNPNAFIEDPIRVLRAVRLAFSMDLKITVETREQLSSAVKLLTNVSKERIRDELFFILEGPRPASAIRTLDILGVIPSILPELSNLKGVEQPPPHYQDVWEHSLSVLNQLEKVLAVLQPNYDPEDYASLYMGVISHRLGRYRDHINSHLQTQIIQDRRLKPLMYLAALSHDIGKPLTKKIDQDGRIRFIDHERVGSQLIIQRGKELQLSNLEIERLGIIINNHMRPLYLTQTGKLPSRRATFRFYRDTGEAGVDVCLLSLADTLATFGQILPTDYWVHQVEVVRRLLETWWEKKDEVIFPTAVVNGNDLILEFKLKPGPIIGKLLEAIREAQATGQVVNRRQAIELAQQFLNEIDEGGSGN